MERNDIISGALALIIGFFVGRSINVLNGFGFIAIAIIIGVSYLLFRIILDKIYPQT